jgi:hypothetical protein
MFRFSIRELMLVTLVVAMGIAWAIDHRAVLAAREMKLPAVTCSVDEENLGGQLFLRYGGFKALPTTEEARSKKVIQFARSASG